MTTDGTAGHSLGCQRIGEALLCGRGTSNCERTFLLRIAAGHGYYFLGYTETFAILLRRQNAGALAPTAFHQAAAFLHSEALGMSGFRKLSVEDATIFGSLSLIKAHNINSADAAILAAYLHYQRAVSEPCLLVASDKRLLRAAEAEGLQGLNPEDATPDGVPAVLLRS